MTIRIGTMLNQKNLLVIVAFFAAVHIVVTFSAHALFQGSMPHQIAWEYTTHRIEAETGSERFHDLEELNETGKDGWEAYCVVVKNDGRILGIRHIVYLKRPL